MKCIYINPIFKAGQDDESSMEDKVYFAGRNTGNCVFVDAFKKQIHYKKEIWLHDKSFLDFEKDNVGVITCSNMINIYDGFFDYFGNEISESRFPITLVGLGAQSTNDLNTPRKLMDALPKERISGIQRVSEKVASIGIRGGIYSGMSGYYRSS